MSYVRNWLHCVWSTKNRIDYLTDDVRDLIHKHIYSYSISKGIYIKKVGGYVDHIHCLLSLSSTQELSKVVNLIKGESSFWINKEKILRSRFQWQEKYFAVSLGESQLTGIIKYFDKQKEHHQAQTYINEVEKIMGKYRFNISLKEALK